MLVHRIMVLSVLSILGIPAVSSGAVIEGIQQVTEIARLTGASGSDSMNPTHLAGIGGVDLGVMVVQGQRTHFLFGDSFESELAYTGAPGTGIGWRWNTLAYSTDADPSDGILFDGWITDNTGRARVVIEDTRNSPITNIPTGAICLGSRIYVWYMSMKDWNIPWKNHFSGLAYSDNGGTNFTIVTSFQFPNNESGGNFGMVSASQRVDAAPSEDDHIYLWGTPAHRYGGVKLARVSPAQIANLAAYEYYGGMSQGQPLWLSSEFTAPLIVPANVGEMSVMYNQWARSWIMLHGSHDNSQPTWDPGDIVLRHAPYPWGPWSDPLVVVDQSASTGLPYGSYLNPLYVEDLGHSFYFTMSRWDPYDVYLMKVTLSGEGFTSVSRNLWQLY